jgi:hypothetical protein
VSEHHYTYEVVTSNGAGVHSKHDKLADARTAMERHAERWSIPDTAFEVQRVRHLAHGSRQYSMRQRSRWVEWDAHRDHTVREPDWLALSTGRDQ